MVTCDGECTARWLLIAALALATPLPAFAQQPPTQAESDATFARGLALYDAKDFAGAAAGWEGLLASMGEAKGWKVLYNLGLAYESALDPTRAVERYDAFLRTVEKEPRPLPASLEDRRQDATDRSRALKATHGAVRVHAPPSGAVLVRIGDLPPRVAPFTAYVRPGHLQVEVGSGGPAPRHIEVDVAAGITADVDAGAAPPPAPTATAPVRPPPTPQEPERSFPTVLVLVGAGLTVASVALPVGLNARAQTKREEAEKLGQGHTDYAAARDDFDSARTLYYVSYGAPALLGAATIAIAVVGAVRKGKARAPAASVGVRADGGGAGLWALGRF